MACPPHRDHAASSFKRRLAAIAFADVVGFSVLMAEDETRTHQRWMAVLTDVIRPQVAQHGGTIIKSLGDAVLVEFPSAFAAVEWARGVHTAIRRTAQRSRSRRSTVVLRIAVHVGDIIDAPGDIYGDGVNIAARLQEFAPPGGTILSEAVHDLVRGSIGAQARDLGPLELKNFQKPVRGYVIDSEDPDVQIPFLPQLGKLPSIAVLPLQNLGQDPADDYFSDGVVEDITHSLAGLRELMVISRGSTLAYRGRTADPREVGRALGVRYVLTGSVRRTAQQVRVSVELCEASTGASLWHERADVAPSELFDVQDRIVGRIAAGIAPNVRAAELRAAMRKRPENFSAYDHTLRALHVIHSLDRATFNKAKEFLEKAIAADPNFAMPAAWAARWHSLSIGQGWSTNPTGDAARAVEFATKAIELDGSNALGLATYGHLKSYLLHDYDMAITYFERALAACPNHSLSWILSGATLSYVGRNEQAIAHVQRALQLSPFDQSLFYYYMFANLAYYGAGQYEEAVKWGRLSASENPHYTANHRVLTAALAALGRLDQAREVGLQLLKLEPEFRVSVWGRTRQPFRNADTSAKYMEHLRRAGLPD